MLSAKCSFQCVRVLEWLCPIPRWKHFAPQCQAGSKVDRLVECALCNKLISNQLIFLFSKTTDLYPAGFRSFNAAMSNRSGCVNRKRKRGWTNFCTTECFSAGSGSKIRPEFCVSSSPRSAKKLYKWRFRLNKNEELYKRRFHEASLWINEKREKGLMESLQSSSITYFWTQWPAVTTNFLDTKATNTSELSCLWTKYHFKPPPHWNSRILMWDCHGNSAKCAGRPPMILFCRVLLGVRGIPQIGTIWFSDESARRLLNEFCTTSCRFGLAG